MDLNTFLEHAGAAFTGGGGAIASVVAWARKQGRRLDRLEAHFKKDGTVPSIITSVGVELDKRDRDLDLRIKRALNTLLTRSSRADVEIARDTARAVAGDAARNAMQAELRPVLEELKRLEREVQRVRDIADGAIQESTLAEHIAADAERWQDVHHSLGSIEGTLTGVRDRLQERHR